jgi:adenylate cyclase
MQRIRMTALDPAQLGKLVRGISLRQIRLVCGLVLFTYLVSHFLNHALGNISLDALAWGVHYHVLFWQFLPVAIIFYTAALLHAGLGIWALYERRQFRWKAIEPLQLVLGLSIPALVIAHIAGVRLGHTLFGQAKLYPQVLYGYWVVWPFRVWLILSVLVVAWIHGSIGLYFWLRMKAFFKPAAPFLLAAAVLVPTLALLGLYQGGRSVARESTSAEWRAANLSQDKVGTPAEQNVLESITDDFLIFYLGLIGFVLAARGVRALKERRGGMTASSGPRPIFPSSRFSCRRPRPPAPQALRISARSATSSACSSICAARPGSPNTGCRSIRCLSSTASSARYRRP